MKIIIISLVAIGALIAGGLALSSSGESTAEVSKTTFSQVQNDISQNAKLIDVRTQAEYANSHFENADNLSLQEIQAGKLPDVPKDTKIYIYCQSGNRSGQAATLLKQAGFTNIVDLEGLSDVQSIGGKLIKT